MSGMVGSIIYQISSGRYNMSRLHSWLQDNDKTNIKWVFDPFYLFTSRFFSPIRKTKDEKTCALKLRFYSQCFFYTFSYSWCMIPHVMFPSFPSRPLRSRRRSEKVDSFLTRVFFVHPSVCPKAIIFFLTAYATYEQEQTKALVGYLSKLKFTEADGILLPDETLPEGFLLDYKRCSLRTMYVPRDGFTLIVSEESIWSSDDRGEQNRKSVRTHYIKEYSLPKGLLCKRTGVFASPFSSKKLFWFLLCCSSSKYPQ